MAMDRPRAPREIATERLLLHSFRAEDAEQVLEAVDASREEIGRWMSWPPYLTEADTSRQEAGRSRERWDAGTSFDYTIRRRADNRFLGAVMIEDPNWVVPSFSLAYWIRTSEQGKGYVSEAVRAVARMAFTTLGARRVQILCDEGNVRSARVAETAGFQLEGLLRNDDRRPDGTLGSSLVFSLIDTDDAVKTLLAGDST
jgi:RimJ/RimL family protein N-acetyltransferase